MKTPAIILLICLSLAGYGQKNVIPVSTSSLTGISLPGGTKQDKRIMIVAAARTLLEMKAGELGRVNEQSVEVFSVPLTAGAAERTKLLQSFESAGFHVTGISDDKDYSLVTGNGKEFLMYLKDMPASTDLYLTPLQLQQPVSMENKVVSSPAGASVTQNPGKATITDAKSASKEIFPPNQAVEKSAEARSGFAFTSTNFDDGWSAVEEKDFVKVTKDDLVVKIYWGEQMTEQMRPPVSEVSDYFWNSKVLPQYQVSQVWRLDESLTYFKLNYMWAEATDKTSGKTCYIGMTVDLSSGFAVVVLAAAPDKNSYDRTFPKPENVKAMAGYNRFAIAYSDLIGIWSESSTSTANYYYANTGNYAGMAFASSAATFIFNADNTYSSKHNGASGMIGNTQSYTQEYKGLVTNTNWEMSLNNRFNGKTEDFDVWMEAVRGGRILHLTNKQASGIKYNLLKAK